MGIWTVYKIIAYSQIERGGDYLPWTHPPFFLPPEIPFNKPQCTDSSQYFPLIYTKEYTLYRCNFFFKR